MKSHAEFFQDTMQELTTLLKEAASCDDIIVQCLNIVRCYHQLGLDSNYSPFLVLVVLDSDADHLPKGSVRNYWNEEALSKKDQESKEIERHYRKEFLASCEDILSMLEG